MAVQQMPLPSSSRADDGRLRLLLVDDSEVDSQILIQHVAHTYPVMSYERVESFEAFRRAVAEKDWDIVLCDYSLILLSPSLVLGTLKQLQMDVPVVVLSGYAGEDAAVEVMRLGAADFVSKERLQRLNSVLERELNGASERRRNALERQRYEQRLEQANKMESIGQLAAGIAHEINTPMQFVHDNLTFLGDAAQVMKVALDVCVHLQKGETATARELALTLPPESVQFYRTEVASAVEQALDGARRVAEIVRAMNDFSHPSEGKLARVALGALIEDALVLSRNEWKHVATASLVEARNVDDVLCYPDELRRALLNLIVNAAHAVAAREDGEWGTIEVSAHSDSAGVYITIRDTGVGIPPEHRHRIFDPFFTTKPLGKGTGQGLSLVYGTVVKLHGGEVLVESQTGEGTTVHIRLPHEPVPSVRHSNPNEPTPSEPTPSEPNRNKANPSEATG